MASFLAAPTYPVASSSTSFRASSRSASVGPSFFGQKHVPMIKSPRAANISSSRSRCLNATFTCSLLDQQKVSRSATSDTLSIVQSTIAEQLSIDVSTVTPETKFADLGADSLNTVEIMMALEEQLEVSVGIWSAESIATVQDAADLIEKVKAASA